VFLLQQKKRKMRRAFVADDEKEKSNKKSRLNDLLPAKYEPKLVGDELADRKKKISALEQEIAAKKAEVEKHLALTQRTKRKLQAHAQLSKMRLTLPIGNDLHLYRQKLEKDEESIDEITSKVQKLRAKLGRIQQEEKQQIAATIATSTFADAADVLLEQQEIRRQHTQDDFFKEISWQAQLLDEELESRRHGGVGVIQKYQKKLNLLNAVQSNDASILLSASDEKDEEKALENALLLLFPVVGDKDKSAHLATVGSNDFLAAQVDDTEKRLNFAKKELEDVPEQQLLQGASQIRSKIGSLNDRHRVRISASFPFTTTSQAHSWDRAPIQAGGAVDALARQQDFITVHKSAADFLDSGLSTQSTNELAQILHNSLLQWSYAKKQMENAERELEQHSKLVRVLSAKDSEQPLQGPYEDPDAKGVFLFL